MTIAFHFNHLKTPDIKTISFSELRRLDRENKFGIVVMGAGGELIEWVNGLDKILKDEGIAGDDDTSVFNFAARFIGNRLGEQGRVDLVLL